MKKVKKFATVTIDGPAGAGKSTIASLVARKLNFISLNTGDIYRAIGLKYKALGQPKLETDADVEKFVNQLNVSVQYINGEQHTFSDGADITSCLHEDGVGLLASVVAPYPLVRSYVIKIQRGIAEKYNTVAEGRDVGVNVLPDAEFKIYLTASLEARARRRFLDLTNHGDNVSYEQIYNEIKIRDERDSHREHGKLQVMPDSFVLDTSNMDIDEVVSTIVKHVKKRM